MSELQTIQHPHNFSLGFWRETLRWLDTEIGNKLLEFESMGVSPESIKDCFIYGNGRYNANKQNVAKGQSFIDAVRFWRPITVPEIYSNLYFGLWIEDWDCRNGNTNWDFKKIRVMIRPTPDRIDARRNCRPAGKADIRLATSKPHYKPLEAAHPTRGARPANPKFQRKEQQPRFQRVENPRYAEQESESKSGGYKGKNYDPDYNTKRNNTNTRNNNGFQKKRY